MRFLFVAPRYHTNQVPIMRGLKEKGHEVCFLSQYAGRVEDYTDITPVVVGYSRLCLIADKICRRLAVKKGFRDFNWKIKGGFPPAGKLARCIRESGADVAILRERSIYSICAYFWCRRYGIPAILYNQSPLWEDRVKEDPAHKIMRSITPGVRMTPVFGVHKPESVREPGAYFIPFVMEPGMDPEERRWQKEGVTRIFCIGKYEERKNQQMLIEIVEQLSKEYPLQLTIAGECTTAAHRVYYEGLEVYIRSHRLESSVTLLQNLCREQVEEQYRLADLFIIPSTREPASISQLEAMAYSLPVICSDANGTACYVENGLNGWQFRDNDKEALAAAVKKMIADPEELRRMGKTGYRFVREKYQIDTYLAGIEQLLSKLKEERK